MTTPVADEGTARASKPSHRDAFGATAGMVGTGVVLGAAFFPLLFSQWGARDDEGVFVFGLREFLNHHGHLYSTIWSDFYGPFYYLVMSTIYRVIHQQPTLENGRWIVLTLTVASAVLFGAAVWRTTKNLPISLLCEVAAFLILGSRAGIEPMHPGSLCVLLVAIVAFELSSYAVTRRTAHLVGIGVAVGALTMTKVNVGGLAAVAVVFVFVVGNRNLPRWLGVACGALTVLLPIVLMKDHIAELWAGTFAMIVIASIAGVWIIVSIDEIAPPRDALLPVAIGAAGAIVVSVLFPLVTGTSISDEINGVFVRPLSLANDFFVPTTASLQWFAFVLTAAGLVVAFALKTASRDVARTWAGWLHAALAVVALWLLGLGVTVFVSGSVANWMPTIVLLPALAYAGGRSQPVRFALRALVLLACLQIVTAYPVAGTQVAWGTVAMVVPCGVALAAAIDGHRIWRDAHRYARGGIVAALCLALIVASGLWPPALWHTYSESRNVGLPGTGLMRIDPTVAPVLQRVTRGLRKNCDTFYGVPSENSFYIFTGLPAPTGVLGNGGPAGLTSDQRAQVAQALRDAAQANERVCVLRDSSVTLAMPPGALASTLKEYSNVVANIGPYTISRRP